MSIRKTLLVIEKAGQMTTALEKRLRAKGLHCLWVNGLDVAIPLLDSRDRICAILLVDDDPVEDSFLNNLKILRQISQAVPIITSTHASSAALEKRIRALGVFFYHTESNEDNELEMAVDCAFQKALKDNLFLPPPGSGGGKG